MEAVPNSTQDTSGANSNSVKSEDSSPRHEGGRGSPPPNCAICLGTCRNKSFTDSCLHQFCFKCLLTWSKVKAECPLCKQTFRSIIHNVRSNHQYEEYMVEQRQTEEIAERIDMDSIVAVNRRFRYRTTLTLPRRETIAIQQLLLRYPMMADMFPSAHRRRSPASFRRTVYRYNLWARPLPDFTGRFRDCTPEFYRYNDSQMHRLVPWLNRELHYLLNENVGHISYVISRILELLPQYHINSSEFRNIMQRYFGERTLHFLHELYCFASTPYDMTGYDRNVQYTTDTRVSTMVNEVLSSTESEASVDSDIVMISSSEPADPPPGPSRVAAPAAPAPAYPRHYIPEPASSDNVIPIETISQSDTDDDSSEVMVVGYIKPPQDRTPEVVDLLGSDSDVIVQDGDVQPNEGPSPPAPRTSPAPPAAPLVKLTLRRHDARDTPDSDSDSASAYTPSPPAAAPAPAAPAPAPAPARRKRRRSADASTTSNSRRTTPSPTLSELSSLFTDCTQSTSSSDSSYDTSTDSDASGREPRHKKLRRVPTYSERCRLTRKRKQRMPPKRSQRKKKSSKDRKRKSKSNSGKGVKSSKSPETSAEPAPAPAPAPEQAGPSGAKRRKLSGRESKRLRSVVKVINDQRAESEAGAARGRRGRRHAHDSDSEDDLPLNLTVPNSSTSL
ncbi:unnamed protein product, partial [Brenthis ino]